MIIISILLIVDNLDDKDHHLNNNSKLNVESNFIKIKIKNDNSKDCYNKSINDNEKCDNSIDYSCNINEKDINEVKLNYANYPKLKCISAEKSHDSNFMDSTLDLDLDLSKDNDEIEFILE